MRIRAVLLSTVLGVTPIVLAQNAKQPWTLTADERIALRTDAARARERVRARARVAANATAPAIADSFDGQTHPELFLPHEVFDQLIALAFWGPPSTCQRFREGFMAEVRAHGLPADFWEQMRVITTVYVADLWAAQDAGRQLRELKGVSRRKVERGLALKQADICRSRVAALTAARARFGAERLDRFLYEAMARHMFNVADRLPDPEVLRRLEDGCR